MRALNEKTRLGHARAAAKLAEHVQDLPAPELFERAQDLKSTAQHADLVHGWKDAAPANVKLRLEVIQGQTEVPVYDVESTVIPEASDDLDDY